MLGRASVHARTDQWLFNILLSRLDTKEYNESGLMLPMALWNNKVLYGEGRHVKKWKSVYKLKCS